MNRQQRFEKMWTVLLISMLIVESIWYGSEWNTKQAHALDTESIVYAVSEEIVYARPGQDAEFIVHVDTSRMNETKQVTYAWYKRASQSLIAPEAPEVSPDPEVSPNPDDSKGELLACTAPVLSLTELKTDDFGLYDCYVQVADEEEKVVEFELVKEEALSAEAEYGRETIRVDAQNDLQKAELCVSAKDYWNRKISYTWYKESYNNETNDYIENKLECSKRLLKLSDLPTVEGVYGKYICKVSVEAGAVNSTTDTMILQEDEQLDVTFYVLPAKEKQVDIYREEYIPQMLTADINGFDNLADVEFVWFLNGKKIPFADNTSYELSEKQREQGGEYTCVAREKDSVSWSRFKLVPQGNMHLVCTNEQDGVIEATKGANAYISMLAVTAIDENAASFTDTPALNSGEQNIGYSWYKKTGRGDYICLEENTTNIFPINEVKDSDFGEYLCIAKELCIAKDLRIAKGSIGGDEYSARATVTLVAKEEPLFACAAGTECETDTWVNAVKGKALTLGAVAYSKESITYTWEQSEDLLGEFTEIEGQNSSVLGITAEDYFRKQIVTSAGTTFECYLPKSVYFRCHVRTQSVERVLVYEVEYTGDFEAEFENGYENGDVERIFLGESMELGIVCSQNDDGDENAFEQMTGEPEVEYAWYHRKNNGTWELIPGGDNKHIEITPKSNEDFGAYGCAVSANGEMRWLEVMLLRQPDFTLYTDNLNGDEVTGRVYRSVAIGEFLSLEADINIMNSYEDEEEPEFCWYKEDAHTGERTLLANEKTSTLEIEKLENICNYVLKTTFAGQTQELSFVLLEKGRMDSAVYVYEREEHIGCHLGDSITLTSGAYSVTNDTTYRWYRFKNDTYELLQEQTGAKLVLNNVSNNDMGTYLCEAKNGGVLKTQLFEVYPYKTTPEFFVRDKEFISMVGENVNVPVESSIGSDCTCVWYRKTGDYYHRTGNGATLSLANVTKAQSGDYMGIITYENREYYVDFRMYVADVTGAGADYPELNFEEESAKNGCLIGYKEEEFADAKGLRVSFDEYSDFEGNMRIWIKGVDGKYRYTSYTLAELLELYVYVPASSFVVELQGEQNVSGDYVGITDITPVYSKMRLNETRLTLQPEESYALRIVNDTRDFSEKANYRAEDESVCRVSANGMIDAVGEGTTTVCVELFGDTYTCVVTVKEEVQITPTPTATPKPTPTPKKKIVPTKVQLNKKTIRLKRGKKYKLKATVTPKKAVYTLKWITGNKKIATVKKGVVRAKKKGKTYITVKTNNGKKARCKVIVK
ncbi:MAG: Ig-like domain-containing protein [Lachnospiraceae bacterium]|nr:Ig-like domain-containing protein [Lachnospiraceae bacterium]